MPRARSCKAKTAASALPARSSSDRNATTLESADRDSTTLESGDGDSTDGDSGDGASTDGGRAS